MPDDPDGMSPRVQSPAGVRRKLVRYLPPLESPLPHLASVAPTAMDEFRSGNHGLVETST